MQPSHTARRGRALPRFLAAFALTLLLPAPPQARADERRPDYAVDVGGVLYAIDCERLELERLGRVEVQLASGAVDRPVLSDLAATPEGYLYGISSAALYLINIEEPQRSQRIGDHGLSGPWGMGAVGERLVVNTAGGGVYFVDRRTGRATRIGAMGGTWAASGDVAMLGERLFSSVKDGAGREHLVELDPESGRASPVGPFRDAEGRDVPHVFGLIERAGALYGLTSSGDLLEIDPRTARVKVLRRTGIRWWGATSYMRI